MIASSTSILLNEWYHVGIVCDGITGYIYVNGVLTDQGPLPRPRSLNRFNNFFGKSSLTKNISYIDASIDEIKIYEGVLAAVDIQSDYSTSSNGFFLFLFSYFIKINKCFHNLTGKQIINSCNKACKFFEISI